MQEKTYTAEELDQIFDTLPDDLKDAIVSVDSANIISEVGKKYGLHIDQIGGLAEATGDILLGISHPTDFVDKLQNNLKIERVRASEIASEINEKIFNKVRESLKNLSGVASDNINQFAPRREDLLEAIEKPEIYNRPIFTTKSPAQDENSKPKNEIPATSDNKPAPEPEKAPSITEKKLGGISTSSRTENVRVVDPYREPV